VSTRSSIAYLNKDGSVDSVYCHFDGYPEGVGSCLVNCHNNDEDAKHIIELGDMSHIEEKLDPDGPHSFDNPQHGVTVFYGRDRGEKNVDSRHWECFDDWFEMAPDIYDADFCYWWDGDMWHCQSPWEEREIYLYGKH